MAKTPTKAIKANEKDFGKLKHKCGYEFCDFKGENRDELFDHLEKVHGIPRKLKYGDGKTGKEEP